MSHTTTTVTRRFYKLKVKSKPKPKHGNSTIRSSGSAHVVGAAKRVPLPPLFQISSALPVLAVAQSPWRPNWKWLSLPVVLGAALWAAIYFSGENSSAERESRSVERRHAANKRAPAITPGVNMRPMRLSSGARASPGEAQPLRTDPASGSETTGHAADQQQHPMPAYVLVNDDHGELFDAGRKVVLPSDVAGACNIGGGGIKDLGTCLLQNGARTE